MGTENIAECLLKDNLYCMVWNKLYKTTYIRDNKIRFQERLPNEDELWTALIACTAKSMYAVQKKTYHYELREGSLMTTKEREPYFQTLIRILQCFYNHAEQQSPVLDSEAMMLVEKRWIREIIKYAPKTIPSYDLYYDIRQCDSRSWNTKLKTHRSVKNIVLHIDQYLPVKVCYAYKYSYATIGSVCQKTIYELKLIKHKLHTFLSKQNLKRNAS